MDQVIVSWARVIRRLIQGKKLRGELTGRPAVALGQGRGEQLDNGCVKEY